MDSKVNYTLVGLFVVVLATALIAGVLWLGADIQRHEYKTYIAYMMESVSGLEENASVKYRGVDVGLVRDISLDPGHPQQVTLLLDIESDVVVRTNDAARLETQGVTGVYYINIVGGTPDAPPVKRRKGAEYPVIETNPSLLGRLDALLSEMSQNLIVTSHKIDDLLNEDNRRALGQILAHFEMVTGSLAGRTQTLKTAVDDFAVSMNNTRQASERLPAILNRVESGVTTIEQVAKQLTITAAGLDQTVQTSGKDIGRFTAQALPEATALVVELRQAVENLRRVSEQLARDPSTIIYGSPEPRLGPGE